MPINGEIIPAKVVYVRNRNKRKEYLCLISTDVNLDENESIRIYGQRWDIEVFFKVCKSYLLFKCCFKYLGQCLRITLSFQMKKSTNWWINL